MKRQFAGLVVTLGIVCGGALAVGAQEVMIGRPAPEFSAVDTDGMERSLGDFRGQFVVLEWSNHECPFVRKHYGSGKMQQLQAASTDRGVVWLTIVSSAPGKQGHVTAEQANAIRRERGDRQTAMLLDLDGTIGRRYGAKTTPHLFIVDPEGILIYAGGIDETPSADPNDIPMATNYVRQALDEAMAGQPVSVPTSQPYGCSVKY